VPTIQPSAVATISGHTRRSALLAVSAGAFAFSASYTNHAPMIPALRAQFGFDQASAGLLTTGVFLTHALMQIPGGRLADRLGPVRVMLAALAWVVIGNVAISGAGSYGALLFWKAFTGFGTGTCFAAGARYTVSSFQGPAMHVAQGVYGGSVLLGSGFVIFAIPQFLGLAGWNGAFLTCAALAAAAWLLWMFGAPVPAPANLPAGTFRGMVLSGALWRLGLVQMASFGLVVVVGTWITTLLKTTFAVPLNTAGLMGSLVLLLGIISRPVGGWLLHRSSVAAVVRGALLVNAIACAVLGFGGSLWLACAAIVALGIGCGLPYAGVFNSAAALFPGRAGAAMGLVNMVGILMILAGSPAVGFIADWTGHFRTSFFALGVFAGLAALASLRSRAE
jgi:nitrate/nitrite transporter NarK